MTLHASNLDTKRFRKVHVLMSSGATEGERKAARARAEAMAAKAGMTLDEATSSLDTLPSSSAPNFFAGFDDWMEEKEPGWKAQKAREKAERDTRDDARRIEVLARYGSKTALFTRTPQEVALDAAIEPLATWDYWTDEDGVEHRHAETLDGRDASALWWGDKITPAVRAAVVHAYPWPPSLADALCEVKAWDRLRLDRGLFCGGEWSHYVEVECRISLLEHALGTGQPVASWDDLQARLAWKRYEYERQWLNPTERDDPFLDRLEADFAILRALPETGTLKSSSPVHSGRRTNADKRKDVLSILDAHPELSDREIARRAGVSPQTVNTWRKRRGASLK